MSTVYMGLVVAEWHCRMGLFRQRYTLPNGPHSRGWEAASRKPAVAPDATMEHSSSIKIIRKRAASLFAAVDSGFEGEPEFTLDHLASGPDAVDFVDVASGGSLAVEGRSEADVDYAGHAAHGAT